MGHINRNIPMRKMTKRQLFFFFSIFFLGAGLRVYNFWLPSLWLDELATYWACAGEGLGSIFTRTLSYHNISPLYHLILKPFIVLCGKNEFSLRLLSVITSLLLMVQIFRIGRYLFSPQAGCFAMLILALSQVYIFQAGNARPYGLAMCFFLLALESFFRWYCEDSNRDKLFFIIWAALTVYAHYIYLTFFIVFIPLCFLGRKTGKKSTYLKDLLLMFSLPMVLLLPVWKQIHRIFGERQNLNWDITYKWQNLTHVFQTTAMLYALILLGLLLLFSRRTQLELRLVEADLRYKLISLSVWSFFPLIFVVGAALKLEIPSLLETRYILIYALPFYLLAGYIFCAISPRATRSVVVMTFLITMILPLVNTLNTYGYLSTDKYEGWREAVEDLNKHAIKGDVIFIDSGLIEAETTMANANPLVKGYITSPLSDFYLKVQLDVIAVSFIAISLSTGKEAKYYSRLILSKLKDVDQFWLLIRGFRLDDRKKIRNWLENSEKKPTFKLISEFEYPNVMLARFERI